MTNSCHISGAGSHALIAQLPVRLGSPDSWEISMRAVTRLLNRIPPRGGAIRLDEFMQLWSDFFSSVAGQLLRRLPSLMPGVKYDKTCMPTHTHTHNYSKLWVLHCISILSPLLRTADVCPSKNFRRPGERSDIEQSDHDFRLRAAVMKHGSYNYYAYCHALRHIRYLAWEIITLLSRFRDGCLSAAAAADLALVCRLRWT